MHSKVYKIIKKKNLLRSVSANKKEGIWKTLPNIIIKGQDPNQVMSAKGSAHFSATNRFPTRKTRQSRNERMD